MEERKEELSYLELCKQQDVIGKVKPLLEQAGYKLRDADGKLYATTSLAWNTPWHHVYHAGTLDCHTWHKILFDFVFTSTNNPSWVPIQCHNCWKVVIRPNSIRGLFNLLDLQKRLKYSSKCGIEVRETVHGLYGGYFYNWGLDEGLDKYEIVRDAIDKEPDLGPKTSVILKRACTEFELKAGRSDEWEIVPEQEQIEALIHRWFVRDIMHRDQPDHAIATVHAKWIAWAYSCGDPTYAEYTNGKPLYPPVVTYHHMVAERKEALKKAEKPEKKTPKKVKPRAKKK